MFPPNQPPRRPLKLSDTSEVKCPCGNNVFTQVVLLRRVSSLLLLPGEPSLSPVPAMACTKCGVLVEDLLPKELQKDHIIDVQDLNMPPIKPLKQ